MSFVAGMLAAVLLIAVVWIVVAVALFSPLKGEPMGHDHN
jgi:hypothetical protein